MGTATRNGRSGMARRSGFIGVGVAVLIALVWVVSGVVAQPRTLAKYREDYEGAKFMREHPTLTRIFSKEETAQAGEVFARDYEALENSGFIMAPIRSMTVSYSHDKYKDLVDPTEREKFEKQRAEREKEEKEKDAEKLKEIREQEKREASE